MGLLSNFLNPEPTETEKEIQRHSEQRRYERKAFDSALKNWVLQSGLGPLILEQTREHAEVCGFAGGWPEQIQMYEGVDFDPRNPQHKEIIEYIEEQTND